MSANSISKWFTLACGSLLIIGCAEDSERPLELNPTDLQPLATAASRDAGVPVFTLPDLELVDGASSAMVRSKNGVSYRLATTGLEPGHAYTLWIVIHNNPNECTDGAPPGEGPLCGPFDVFNDDARPDMMFAAGHVIGGSGKATFAGRRHVGDESGSANGPVGLPAYGLEAPFDAEIHLVVHDHGPKLPAYMPDMIQTVDGGCTDAGIPEEGFPSFWNLYEGPPGVGAFGRRGPNTCASVQVAVHSPVQ